jgi:hypothetical protein
LTLPIHPTEVKGKQVMKLSYDYLLVLETEARLVLQW